LLHHVRLFLRVIWAWFVRTELCKRGTIETPVKNEPEGHFLRYQVWQPQESVLYNFYYTTLPWIIILQTVESAELEAHFSYLAVGLVHRFIGYGGHVNVSKRELACKALRH
jgi:hypothetical protein